MTKEQEIMAFLRKEVFDPVLASPSASKKLKDGVRMTMTRMSVLKAESMVAYYWHAITGTEKSIRFAEMMRREGFSRFEDPGVIDEFRDRFDPPGRRA
jgi:hypothetical protein